MGGTSSCDEGAIKGLRRENVSEILRESLRSTGDFMAMMLVRDVGPSSKEIGDCGTEDVCPMSLLCGKTIMPHLLTGRIGTGVNSGGVTGEIEVGRGGSFRTIIPAGP